MKHYNISECSNIHYKLQYNTQRVNKLNCKDVRRTASHSPASKDNSGSADQQKKKEDDEGGCYITCTLPLNDLIYNYYQFVGPIESANVSIIAIVMFTTTIIEPSLLVLTFTASNIVVKAFITF